MKHLVSLDQMPLRSIAIFSIEEKSAARFLQTGRIHIGWINCRMRRREQVTRCFRCLRYSHVSRICKGPNRSSLCYKCGDVVHKAMDCTCSLIQDNLNRSRTAQDLLAQINLEKNANIVIISERYRDGAGAVTPAQVKVVTSMTMQIIHRAYEEAISRRRVRGGIYPAY